MTRLQAIAATVVAVFLLLSVVAAAVSTGMIIMEGVKRSRTRIAFEYANWAWRRGHVVEAGQGLLNGTRMAVEGGIRWHMASYLLNRTEQLRNGGRLSDAVAACWAASEALGRYDNYREVYRECVDLYWEEQGY
jgi:hypothetical protein